MTDLVLRIEDEDREIVLDELTRRHPGNYYQGCVWDARVIAEIIKDLSQYRKTFGELIKVEKQFWGIWVEVLEVWGHCERNQYNCILAYTSAVDAISHAKLYEAQKNLTCMVKVLPKQGRMHYMVFEDGLGGVLVLPTHLTGEV